MAGSGKISIESLHPKTQPAIRTALRHNLPCTRETLEALMFPGTDLESIPMEDRPNINYYLPSEVNFPEDLDLEAF